MATPTCMILESSSEFNHLISIVFFLVYRSKGKDAYVVVCFTKVHTSILSFLYLTFKFMDLKNEKKTAHAHTGIYNKMQNSF